MLLRTKIRKLQTGASLNLARNEAPPVDIRWKQLDISGYKNAPLDIPASMLDNQYGGGSKSGALGGIPSDITFANDQLQFYRNKLKTKLSAPGGAEYGESAEAENDSQQIIDWSKKLTMLKSMEDNFKLNKTKLQKAGMDDYAMFGGKALVKDNSTGEYTIASTVDALTARIKDNRGALKSKYTPATVGEALAVRFDDPKFSGFIPETGGMLEQILSNVTDSESVYKDMDNLFKEAGMINEDNGTFVSKNTGTATSITDLVKNLEDAATASANNNTSRSNEPTLRNAVSLFTQELTPGQIQTLRNKAMAQFVNTYGNKETTEAQATEWVNNQVNATIAKRASIYLNFAAQGKAGKKAAGPTEGADDLSKLKVSTNEVTLARMGVGGEKVTIEGDFKDAEDLQDKFTLLAHANANSLPISKAYAQASGAKGENKFLDKNQFIKALTGDQIQRNFFLADSNSTPVNDLNGGRGLSRAVVNPTGGPAKILQGMPYTKDENGNYKIAWEKVKQVTDWGRKYRELYNEKLNDPKRPKSNGAHLTPQEKLDVIAATEKLLGKLDNDPNVKRGDIAMIPILVDVPPKGYHDTLENVMSNKINSTELAELDKGSWAKNVHKTFAFTVLPNGPIANLPEAYGPAMKIDKEMSVQQILDDYATTARTEIEGFDVMSWLMNAASTSPTVTK